MKPDRRPLRPRSGVPGPKYPALTTGVAILLGAGAASSCGGGDGGTLERYPDGTHFTHEPRDAGAGDAGDGGAGAGGVGAGAGDPMDTAGDRDAGASAASGANGPGDAEDTDASDP
ncbi:MAG TPA: hypothetical protein PLU22_05460 [Polyangiaceae bacterium]|mgnify:FL=1|nr:hypothetical protein [Polyangiaceae bacterium]